MQATLTADLASQIVSRITDGASLEDAGRANGVSRSTIWRWRRRGQEITAALAEGAQPSPTDALFREFAEDVDRARARAKVEAISIIRRAALGQKVTRTTTTTRQAVVAGKVETLTSTVTVESVEYNWQAAAWFLERTYPTEYALRNRLELSGPEGGPIPIEDRVRSIAAEAEQFLIERDGAAAAPVEPEAT